MRRRWLSTAALCALSVVALCAADQALPPLVKADADRLEKKLAIILERGALTGPQGKALRTTVTDREVNAYFKFQGAEQLPVGVVNPNIGILEAGRLTGVVTVDLDAVRKSKERAWSDPLAYITGVLDLRVTGRLSATNGKGVFQLESVTLGGVPLAKAILQEVVYFYTRTPESPAGFNFDQPFDLPQRVRQVDLQRGSAVIVQ
jgi:hypothetical protein